MSTISVLVDLDGLLDTRLATAEKVKPGLAAELLSNGWNDRTTDKMIWELGGFDERVYKEAYGRRDYTLLPTALRTPLYSYIDNSNREMIFTEDVDKGTIEYSVTVNVFPYLLSKEEAEELTVAVQVLIPSAMKVILTSVDPRTISTDYLESKEYTHYYTYDILNWLKRHHEQAIGSPTPRLSVLGPMLREGELTDLTEDERKLAEVITPWESMEQTFSFYFMLRFIDIDNFCLDTCAS